MIRAASILLALVTPAVARAIELAQPIDCVLGETCYIQQFFDHDTGPGVTDFTCGTLSYDGHDGTDFALPTLSDQARGVAVLAAADGVVTGVRDEMPDILQTGPDAPDVSDRECGNGVAIRHPDGWETQYCHMRLGSIIVEPGQTVTAGTVLGEVGLSGQTQFPHLHLSVRENGTEVDPFFPSEAVMCSHAVPDDTLWAAPVTYVPGGVTAAGFSAGVPDYEGIKAGTANEQLQTESPGLVLWGLMFGGRTGDKVTFDIEGPDGRTVHQDVQTLDRPQALLFRASGRRIPDGGWAPGLYQGRISLVRGRDTVDSMIVTTEIPAN